MKNNSDKSPNLRRKAEELLEIKLSKSPAPSSGDDTLKLIHELQVHQIELEMQNEELILSRASAEEAAEKYIQLYDFAPSGYFTLSKDGEIIDLNLSAAKLLGKDRQSLKNRLFRAYLSYESKHIFNTFLEKAFAGKCKESCEVTLSINANLPSFVHLDGVVNENDGQCLVTAIDITQRKNAEEELKKHREHLEELVEERTNELNIERNKLLKAQEIENIGILSAGVAHNFNNILSVILGYSNLLLEEYDDGGNHRDYIENIIKQIKRASTIADQLISFAKPEEPHMQAVDLVELIKETAQLLQDPFAKDNIEVKLSIDSKCRPILAESEQIRQLLVNVLSNSADAMENNGGVIEIEVKELFLDSKDVPNFKMEAGNYLMLSIKDSGHGMTKNVMEKIFNPFFTTKEVGKGTGLGLYTVHNTIRDHKGGVSIESEPGKGATFKFYFPVLEVPLIGKETSDEIPKKEEPTSIEGRARILVAEDEEMLRVVYELTLAKLGHRVTLACDGLEALELFKANPDDFDIIITDQAMPKMRGTQLCMEALKIRPEIPVMLVTGYSNESESMAKACGVKYFMRKPIATEELSKVIEESLKKN